MTAAAPMLLTYKYRLNPERRQHRAQERILECDRQLYIAALTERIEVRAEECGHRRGYDPARARIWYRNVHGLEKGHRATGARTAFGFGTHAVTRSCGWHILHDPSTAPNSLISMINEAAKQMLADRDERRRAKAAGELTS